MYTTTQDACTNDLQTLTSLTKHAPALTMSRITLMHARFLTLWKQPRSHTTTMLQEAVDQAEDAAASSMQGAGRVQAYWHAAVCASVLALHVAAPGGETSGWGTGKATGGETSGEGVVSKGPALGNEARCVVCAMCSVFVYGACTSASTGCCEVPTSCIKHCIFCMHAQPHGRYTNAYTFSKLHLLACTHTPTHPGAAWRSSNGPLLNGSMCPPPPQTMQLCYVLPLLLHVYHGNDWCNMVYNTMWVIIMITIMVVRTHAMMCVYQHQQEQQKQQHHHHCMLMSSRVLCRSSRINRKRGCCSWLTLYIVLQSKVCGQQ